MPRSGGVYTVPAGTDGVAGAVIESAKYNVFIHDIETDLNAKRPVIAGGTGAGTTNEALVNLGGEAAYQTVSNFNSAVFAPGSWRADTGAIGGPVAGHAFSGIAYMTDAPPSPSTAAPPNTNVILLATDLTDTTVNLYMRRKLAGVWQGWVLIAPGGGGSVDITTKVDKAGDTMTGNLTISKNNPSMVVAKTGSGQSAQLTGRNGGNLRWTVQVGDGGTESGSNAGSDFRISRYDDGGNFIDSPYVVSRQTKANQFSGDVHAFDRLINYGSNNALKPGGGPWADSSDSRIKTITGNYTDAVAKIKQLQPKVFQYKANETNSTSPPLKPDDPIVPPGDPDPRSPHYTVRGEDFIGLIAQDVEPIFPTMVAHVVGTINGAPVTDLRVLDTTQLIYALVNSVKELATRVEALEAA
jgi:Chaperone of endosialidase